MEPQLIQDGDQVVFFREGWSRVFQIRRNRQIYLDKTSLYVDTLIGQPYGSTFEVDRGKLKKMEQVSASAKELSFSEASASPGTDNRNLLDLDSNQKMSKEDIMKMKDEGITGQKIIEELIENSETFKMKTEFSQAKYLKKKRKKHIPVFTILRPTPRLVLEIFSKDPTKICNLRADSLSQLLSYSNVMYGSRVAVVETCQGLVLSCLLQRIGEAGKIVQLIPSATNAVSRQVMEYLGFAKYTDNVYTFPMDELTSLAASSSSSNAEKTEASEKTNVPEGPEVNTVEGLHGESVPEGSESNANAQAAADDNSTANGSDDAVCKDQGESEAMGEDKVGMEEPGGENTSEMEEIKRDNVRPGEKRPLGPKREAQRQQREKRQKEAGEIIRDKQLDSLVIACKYNPTPIVLKMLEFLRPSSSVVVYCQHLEPLVECYTRVKESYAGLQLKLSETWFREYQILPQRTHPKINMSGTGGYMFTFITSQRSAGPKKL